MDLLFFAFWPHQNQKTGFEASERNKDALHALRARKFTLDAFHTIHMAAFLARASLNRILKTKRRQEEGRESEREERKRRKGRERRKGEKC